MRACAPEEGTCHCHAFPASPQFPVAFSFHIVGFEACSPSPRAFKFLGGETRKREIKLIHVTLTKLLCACQEVRPREGGGFAQSHSKVVARVGPPSGR